MPLGPSSRKIALHVFGAFLFYCFLYIIFFAPVLFSGQLLAPGDGVVYYLPAFYMPYSLWTTLLSSGFPVAADPQIQSWYPLKLLFSYFHAWNSFVISAYVLASFFTYSYVLTITSSSWCALISGIIYGMSGFMIAHLGHTSMVHNALWLPLIVLALEKLRHDLTVRWFIVGTLAITCSTLAGHTQIFVYSLGLSIVYGMALGWSAVVGRWRYYTLCLAILALGLSLAAVQLIPSSELAGMGLRSRLSFGEFVSFALPSYQVIGLLFPYLFGGVPVSFYGLPWFGEWNPTELSGYIGLLPLMMASLGLAVYGRDPMVLFWSSVGLFSFLLALGEATPLARLMYHVPMYNKFRVPARHFIEMALAVSILAGIGMSVCRRQVVEKSLLVRVIGIIGVLLFSGLFAVYWYQADLRAIAFNRGITKIELSPWTNPAIGFPLLILIASGIVLLYWKRKPVSNFRKILVIFVVVLDLASFGMFYEWKYAAPTGDVLEIPADAKRYKEILTTTKQRLMPINGSYGTMAEIPPNISMTWGIPSAGGYGPLGLKRVRDMLSMTADGKLVGSWASTADRSLDLLAVRYVFLSPQNLKEISLEDVSRWRYVEKIRDLDRWRGKWFGALMIGESLIYENLRAMPRAWLVPHVVSLEPVDVLHVIKSSQLPDGREFDPSKLALVEETIELKEDYDERSIARILTIEDESVVVGTKSTNPAVLVLSDIYYPGWTVTVDGSNKKILTVNYVLRGVLVPEGEHLVRFEFRPRTFYLGATISIFSFVGLLVGAAIAVWRRKGQ